LGFILIVSFGLRVFLAVRGGQFYWIDETRFAFSRGAAGAFLSGHLHAGLDELFSSPDHLLFKIVGVVPALLEKIASGAPWVAAVFFGSFSV